MYLRKSRADLISIHTLRTEGDYIVRIQTVILEHFYPHPPHGG